MLAETAALATFITVLLLVVAIYWMGLARVEVQSQELARRLGPGNVPRQVTLARRIDPVAEALGGPGDWLYHLQLRAGRPPGVGGLLARMGLFAVLGVLMAWLLGGSVGALLGAGLGVVPILALQAEGRERGRKLTAQLPDGLDLVVRALRAGHGLHDALRVVGAEMPAPIGVELAHVSEEHRLGLDLAGCLKGLVRRAPDSFEMRLFVSAVLLHRETGGNLIEVLEHLADTLRERVVFESKVKALTAEVRASAFILEALPFAAAVMLTAVAPDYLLPLLSPGLGRALLGYALASMAVGILVMRRISTVEY